MVLSVNQKEALHYIQTYVDEYKRFVGVNYFPDFLLQTKKITLERSLKTGYDSLGVAYYDVNTGSHRLEIGDIFLLPQMNCDYLIFHEFTHIMDAERFSQKNSLKHMSNKGYTEYHAAQIDFMKILGAKNISEPFSFSMNQTVETFGGTKSAYEFVDMPRLLAEELILREDFPADIETLSTTLGSIFNYLGRRSICKMYASDYVDIADTQTINGFLGVDLEKSWNLLMVGWFDNVKVNVIDPFYANMLEALLKRFKFI